VTESAEARRALKIATFWGLLGIEPPQVVKGASFTARRLLPFRRRTTLNEIAHPGAEHGRS